MREMKSSRTFNQKLNQCLNMTNFLILISFILFALMRNQLIWFDYYVVLYIPLGINTIIFIMSIKYIYLRYKIKNIYKNKYVLNLFGNMLMNLTLLILVTIQIMR